MAEQKWTRMHETIEDAWNAHAIRITRMELDMFKVRVTPHCQSNIERMLAAALYFGQIVGLNEPRWVIAGDVFASAGNKLTAAKVKEVEWLNALLVPQLRVLKYRVDFGLFVYAEGKELKLAIECDGHDFHEKTKEQAAHDKKRDRAITAEGYRMFRFTGSEIWRDALGCADEVCKVASDWLNSCGPTLADLEKK